MSVALENARLFGETKRLLAETDERAAELAIINERPARASPRRSTCRRCTTSSATRSARSSTHRSSTSRIYDRAAETVTFPYTIERGVRFPEEHMPLIGIRKHVVETARAAPRSTTRPVGSAERFGQPAVLSGEAPQSALFAPLIAGGEAVGVISLQNLDREYAFSDVDVRLLTTLAASLSVALENARLIHETRQRVAELATVHEIGQAFASQLDLDRMYELVGERIGETFSADLVYVAMHRHRDRPDRVRLLQRRRHDRAQGGVRLRRGPDLAHHPDRASRCCSTATRTSTGSRRAPSARRSSRSWASRSCSATTRSA